MCSLDGADAGGLGADGACYRKWGWPVSLHGDQVRLSLYCEASALTTIPRLLGIEVTEILTCSGPTRCTG